MLRPTALILALVATTAQAECYVRSAMTNQTRASITAIADVDPFVVPISPTQNKCIVNYRAQVNGNWVTVEGTSVGAKSLSEEELCRGAIDSSKAQLLSRTDAGNLNIETNMVCDERPAIQVKNVRIGELVRISEVRPHPNFPKPFIYRTAQCRWFIEPEPRVGDLLQRQGIICQSHGDIWRVIDKW
jgi:hypothetical protein